MAEAIDRAKADDPRELRARVAELERELARAKAAKPPPAPPPPAPVFLEDDLLRLEKCAIEIRQAGDRAVHAAQAVQVSLEAACRPSPAPTQPAPQAPAKAVPATNGRSANGGADIGTGAFRRMMIALAQRPEGLTQRQLGVRAQVSSRSGTFSTYLSRARTAGWIEGRVELRITAAGVAALGPFEKLPTGRELLDYWASELGTGGASRILRVVADAYPQTITQHEVAERAGLSDRSGSFSTYLSKLRTLQLVEGRGELRASEELFAD